MIVIAPPFSGKTTLVKKDKSFRDGDDVVAKGPGYPPGEWWKQPNAADVMRKHIEHVVAEDQKDKAGIILWATDYSHMDPKTVGAVWVPNALPERAKKGEAERKAIGRPTPTAEEVIASLGNYKDWAKRNNIPIITADNPDARTFKGADKVNPSTFSAGNYPGPPDKRGHLFGKKEVRHAADGSKKAKLEAEDLA